MVPGAGLEPAQSYDREILSLSAESTNSAFLELLAEFYRSGARGRT